MLSGIGYGYSKKQYFGWFKFEVINQVSNGGDKRRWYNSITRGCEYDKCGSNLHYWCKEPKGSL